MTQDHDAKQLDLDGIPIGIAYRVKIKARRPSADDRPEGDPAIRAGGHDERERTYSVRATTWREAIDQAMDLYPVTVEDGTRYTVIVEES